MQIASLMNRLTRILILLILNVWTFGVFAQVDSTFIEVDQMPYFSGCDHLKNGSDQKRACSNENLVRFIANTLEYPDLAKEENIEGTVIISFVVNKKGLIEQQEVIKDIGGGCGTAALSVLDEMARWEAGQHTGQPVNVQLRLPVNFLLNDGYNNNSTQFYEINWGTLRGKSVNKMMLKENMTKAIIVRDAQGDSKIISQLTISYEKGSTYLTESSNGTITPLMQKLIKKAKKGGILTLEASVQESGEFVDLKRAFLVQ